MVPDPRTDPNTLKLMVIDDEEHKQVNLDCVAILNGVGLKIGQDYHVFSAPPALDDHYETPILHVPEGGKFNLGKQEYYGK